MDEVLQDLKVKNYKTLAFNSAIVIIVFMYFLRLFTHYTGQYFILRM